MLIYLLIAILAIVLGGIVFLSSLFKVWRKNKKLEWMESQQYTVLRIDVPKNNDKAPLAAEQMFAALHGVYSDSAIHQYQISYEIVAKDKYIQFYVHTPIHLKDFVEGQIYAQYPTVEIKEVSDYTFESQGATSVAGCELLMTKPDVYPIKLFSDFEVDPISGITSVMSKLGVGEQVWLQIIMRPVGDEWQDKGNQLINAIRAGKKTGTSGALQSLAGGITKFGKMFITQALNPGAEVAEGEKTVNLPGTVEEALKSIEYKIVKLGFETKIRIMALSADPVSAKVKAQNIAAAYKQYNTTNLNGFVAGEVKVNDSEFISEYVHRKFHDNGNILNIAELASIYHFPNETVATPNIVWSGSKKGEPPANLPLAENTPKNDLTVIGETTFRNTHQLFGVKRDDRRRHIYVIGKSGVGKSVLLENMAIHDVLAGKGIVVVDPHGEFAEKVLACVPDDRVDDVIVFDPADRAHPIAFNLLEHVDDDFKGMVASGFVGIFKKIFGNSWGPRLEHILRNTVLALLDFPDSTMLDIPKMLTETRFRDKVVESVQDPVIKEFWTMEFAQYDNKFRTEAVSPILNKVGQFLATATIRNIVGQPKSTINIREIMDSEKIMVVNLSRGKIGEDNSALLGAMMITKIQLAAMSRADITVDQRPDCYLYVDEFQNFATESFSVILSEARKYHLNLTIANQYITQMPEEVRDAVFGNAGTIISFRVGGADADFLVKEFEPVFEANDMVNLDKFNIYIKLLIDGVSSPAFSARTLPPVQVVSGNAERIIELSRKKYTRSREDVEAQIAGRSLGEQEELKAEAEAFKSGGLEAILLKKKNQDMPARSAAREVSALPKETEHNREEAKPAHDSAVLPVKQASVQGPAQVSAPEQPKEVVYTTEMKNPKISDDAAKEDVQTTEKEKKPRLLKHKNIIGDKLFKEQTARGGIKWYVGEQINIPELEENGVVVTDAALKMMDLAKKVYTAKSKTSEPSQKHDKKKHDDRSSQNGGSGGSSHENKVNEGHKADQTKHDKGHNSTEHKGKIEVSEMPSKAEGIPDGKTEKDDIKIKSNVEESSAKELDKLVDKHESTQEDISQDEADQRVNAETVSDNSLAEASEQLEDRKEREVEHQIKESPKEFVVIYDGEKDKAEDSGNEKSDDNDAEDASESNNSNSLIEGEAVKLD